MAKSSRQIVDLSFDATAVIRGRANEDRVENVLLQMKESGEIAHYHKSVVGGELNRRGIDFQVYPEHDWSIDLQVKSSILGKEDHLAEYGHSIACVIVHDALDDRQLLEETRRILGLSLQGILERH